MHTRLILGFISGSMEISFAGKRALVTGAGKGTVCNNNITITLTSKRLQWHRQAWFIKAHFVQFGSFIRQSSESEKVELWEELYKLYKYRNMIGMCGRHAGSSTCTMALCASLSLFLCVYGYLVFSVFSGIGRATALALVRCGAEVTAVTRTRADLDSLVLEVHARTHPRTQFNLISI